MRFRQSLSTLLTSLAVAGAVAGCGGDGGTEPSNRLDALLNSISVEGGGTATLRTGDAPAASGGPAASVVAGSFVAQGGTGEVVITSATAFNRVYVSAEGRPGYYEINLPAPVTSATLLLTFGTSASGAQTISYQLQTAAGAVGAAQATSVTVLDVGTGDVQVTLTWNTPADVDLHVVDPAGEEIYYGNRNSASGGVLDLDSNAACGGEDRRAENITWNANPPRGTYIVRVNYWSECSAASTDYVVTVRREGQATMTFTGTFTGSGTGGGEGDGVVITSFTF